MFNLCVLSGQVVDEPELSFSEDGEPRTLFTLAFGKQRTQPCRINVFCQGKKAALATKYVHQGDHVAVVGFLSEYRKEETDEEKGWSKWYLIACSLDIIQGIDPTVV